MINTRLAKHLSAHKGFTARAKDWGQSPDETQVKPLAVRNII